MALFEKYWAREQQRREAAKAANVAISIVLPDGSTKPGVAGVTTPMDIAAGISKSLAKRVVVADVDGDAWDLQRPLQGDCALKLYSFEDVQGKDVSRKDGERNRHARVCARGCASTHVLHVALCCAGGGECMSVCVAPA